MTPSRGACDGRCSRAAFLALALIADAAVRAAALAPVAVLPIEAAAAAAAGASNRGIAAMLQRRRQVSRQVAMPNHTRIDDIEVKNLWPTEADYGRADASVNESVLARLEAENFTRVVERDVQIALRGSEYAPQPLVAGAASATQDVAERNALKVVNNVTMDIDGDFNIVPAHKAGGALNEDVVWAADTLGVPLTERDRFQMGLDP
eukprot:TRINITY_DN16068_c0_g1_i2.p2 TRINITY_DN16068_c0_g1~~TRINITY_DN16068_c0_g1_i2.p2  ORF type:complete len:206 (-),score=62.37 TRINITY_DN16068_c0_g1_i2:35-652(-)